MKTSGGFFFRGNLLLSIFYPQFCQYAVVGNEFLNEMTVSLAEPRTGFDIAFQMLDVDGNEQVDKKEFLTVRLCLEKKKTSFLDGELCNYFK